MPADLRLPCPGCNEEVEISAELAGQLVRCPYCNTDFFASVEQSHAQVVDDTEPASAQLETAIDQLRIHRLTALRMSAVRSRSWWIVGLWTALIAIADSLFRAGEYIWKFHRWGWWPTLYLVIIYAAARCLGIAWRRAAELKREIDKSLLDQPTVPPDFSTLSDGSERWKDLENVR